MQRSHITTTETTGIYSDAYFSAIYLGVNISKEDRGKVIECGRKLNSDIQVYQMVVNPDAFKLDFINIS